MIDRNLVPVAVSSDMGRGVHGEVHMQVVHEDVLQCERAAEP